MNKFTIRVITPLTRVKNLSSMKESIEANRGNFNWGWRIYVDAEWSPRLSSDIRKVVGGTSLSPLLDWVSVWYAPSPRKGYGGYQRTTAIGDLKFDRDSSWMISTDLSEAVADDPWLYFLDDDNVLPYQFADMLMREFRQLENRPADTQFPKMIIGSRKMPNGTIVPPNGPRVNHVDTGQLIVKLSAIPNKLVWGPEYDADGRFYEAVAKAIPGLIHETPDIVFNYNALA